jgi:hypothetical protein
VPPRRSTRLRRHKCGTAIRSTKLSSVILCSTTTAEPSIAPLRRGVSDVTISQFQYAGEVRAQVFVSRLRAFKAQRLGVVGADKMAVSDESALDQLVTIPRRDGKDPGPAGEEAPASRREKSRCRQRRSAVRPPPGSRRLPHQ